MKFNLDWLFLIYLYKTFRQTTLTRTKRLLTMENSSCGMFGSVVSSLLFFTNQIMKKLIYAFALLSLTLIIAWCGNYESKLEKIKDKSGYTDCMKAVEKKESDLKQCINTKLASSWYNDGIDCIQNSENPKCEDISRYNAEVDASNWCGNTVTGPSLLECSALLNK